MRHFWAHSRAAQNRTAAIANKNIPKPKVFAISVRSIGTGGGAGSRGGGTGSGGGASPVMGRPQCGQARALSLTLLRHSGQSI